MSGIILRCGCTVTQDGKYIVGERCRNCKECNHISNLHPFGMGRLQQ